MKNSTPSIDWNGLFAKLTAVVVKWFVDKNVDKNDPMINGTAPKDLAQTAALEVFKTFHQNKHLKTEEDIFREAYKVMWRDFLDLIKSAGYRKNKRIEEINGENPGKEVLPVNDGKFLDIEDRSAVERFYELAKGEQELIDFITAVLELKVYKREDVAKLLDITPQEVTNSQRKLRYRYESRQKKSANSARLKLK